MASYYSQYSHNHDSRHANRRPERYAADAGLTNDMAGNAHRNHSSYYPSSTSYGGFDPYDSRYLPHRTRPRTRSRRTWPPSPSAEDEKDSLQREVGSGSTSEVPGEEDIPRGDVDQHPIILEVERPKMTDDRRFVLVSDPAADGEDDYGRDGRRDRRKKSFAERGNMVPLKTGTEDPPLFTDRNPMPYAYTKPQKESLAPTPGEYTLSPEVLTPEASTVPRLVPHRETWGAERDQNKRPSKPTPTPMQNRYDSVAQTPKSQKNDVFEDSDTDDSGASYLRADLTERKPARYSFVKSDLSRDDLRTSLSDQQAKAEKKPTEQPSRSSRYHSRPSTSSSSSKAHTPGTQSPRSSASSLNNGTSSRRRERPAPVETSDRRATYESLTRPSRPHSPAQQNSPLHHVHVPSPPRSPRPQQPAGYPSSPRPSSRTSTTRPSSPLSATPQSAHPRIAVTEADWRSTYPPVTSAPGDRSRPPSRVGRHETMPMPTPRIDIKSPSPSRPPKPINQRENPLPYPVDSRSADYFMPPEETYQFDHSNANTPTSPNPNMWLPYAESPKAHAPGPGSGSSRDRDRESYSSSYAFPGPSIASRYTAPPEDLEPPRPHSPRTRSRSHRPHHRRIRSLDRPLPSCPRSSPSHEPDWYTLDGCRHFDICPSCYTSVFADTPFAGYFQPVRRYDARFCDFSSPWMRLAWLMTVRQRRERPDLLYQIATVAEYTLPCPGERDKGDTMWYGIPDPRDGVPIANFAVCEGDVKMLEVLCPTLRGCFTPLPPPNSYAAAPASKRQCALWNLSKRFPKYLDLLVDIDAEAQATRQLPDIARFIKLAREYAFKPECLRGKAIVGRAWHFIPSLPEFTVCEECFDDVVLPYWLERNRVARLFNGRTMLAPNETDTEGTSCCLYSPRMRRVFERAAEEEDYGYLRRKSVERKRVGERLGREKRVLEEWVESLNGMGLEAERERERERLGRDLRALDEEWADVE